MKCLIINSEAEYIKSLLEPRFPELQIHAAIDEDEVGEFIEGTEIIITKRISDDLVKRASKLKWIQSMLSGVDNMINLPSFKEDVLFTSSRGIHGPQMSELAVLLMMLLTRNFYRIMKDQENHIWERRPAGLLLGKKAGILGVGVIGKEIARKCKEFGMTVYGLTRTKRDMEWVDHSYGKDGLMEVLGEVDYVINLVPLTPDTSHMIGTNQFSGMKPTAFFISLGRGATVNEEALVQALENGEIAGAGLDVFQMEPLPRDHPLWDLKNVIITPHIGGRSDIYSDQILPILEENLRRYLKGERRELINFVERRET